MRVTLIEFQFYHPPLDVTLTNWPQSKVAHDSNHINRMYETPVDWYSLKSSIYTATIVHLC